MMVIRSLIIAIASMILVSYVEGQLSNECSMQCNDLRTEVLTLAMCKDAKKTLPKPKVGDFCSSAMEQGFSDACGAICMDRVPINRLAQTCRNAAMELPRPTVRKWCEHGYKVAYEKTITELKDHFKQPVVVEEARDLISEEAVEEHSQELEHSQEDSQTILEEHSQEHVEDHSEIISEEHSPEISEEHSQEFLEEHSTMIVEAEPEEVIEEKIEEKKIVKIEIPITMDEDKQVILTVFEGENAEESVVKFCRENSPDDIPACIRQLLPTVIDKLGE